MAPTEREPAGLDSERLVELPGSSHERYAASLPASYYDFGSYVSKNRMLTFWYQIDAVLKHAPQLVLEVGKGPGVVAGTLREQGVAVTTVDSNESLAPDAVASVLDLDRIFEPKSFDTVLCARVLHHLPFDDFDRCLHQLARVAKNKVVLTLPSDEARVYIAVRRTAGSYRIGSVALPKLAKSAAARVMRIGDSRYQRLWKIGSDDHTSLAKITRLLENRFVIDELFALPEDQSHVLAVLSPK